MKYIRVVFEGAADTGCEVLKNLTPLETAQLQEASALARAGRGGFFDIQAPRRSYRPMETLALLLGVGAEAAQRMEAGPLSLFSEDLLPEAYALAYRGSLVTLDGDDLAAARLRNMTEAESHLLLEAIRPLWQNEGFELHLLESGRFLAARREPLEGAHTGVPPFMAFREPWTARQPLGRRKDLATKLFQETHRILDEHDVNRIRLDLSEDPANGVWLWGGGSPAELWAMRKPRKGVLLSQSRLTKGLARWLSMDSIEMDSPWAAMEGKQPGFRIGRVAELLRERNELTVYVGAPMEWAWYGTRPQDKARAMKMLDLFVLHPLLSMLEAYRPYRLLLTTDGRLSVEQDAPLEGGIPFVLTGQGIEADACMNWDERACREGSLGHGTIEDVLNFFERSEDGSVG